MNDLSTLHKKDLKSKANKKSKNNILKWRFFGSALTVALSLCMLQLLWGSILNITKIVFYKVDKIPKSLAIQDKVFERNLELKNEKNNFTKEKAEEYLRNNLKMAKPNEIVIMIYDEDKIEKEPKNLWDRILIYAYKNFDIDSENLT